MPVITQLYVYPVKSMQGIPLEKGELTVRGLRYDRNWMVVDGEGRFLTQREQPKLASLRVRLSDDHLYFTNPQGDSISVPLEYRPGTDTVTEIWGERCEALDEGDDISEWLTQTLRQSSKKSLRLVRFKDAFRRNVDKKYLRGEDAHTAFSDGFPFLVTVEESLSMLNDRLINTGAIPVSMDRFRPNIVIKGLEPFQENRLRQLVCADGRFTLGIRKPCKRCKITTVDQQSGGIADPKEPLRTLALMRTVPDRRGAFFGQNATLVSGEGIEIRRGDLVEI